MKKWELWKLKNKTSIDKLLKIAFFSELLKIAFFSPNSITNFSILWKKTGTRNASSQSGVFITHLNALWKRKSRPQTPRTYRGISVVPIMVKVLINVILIKFLFFNEGSQYKHISELIKSDKEKIRFFLCTKPTSRVLFLLRNPWLNKNHLGIHKSIMIL